ncbi:dynein axonemal heavy chain 11 [Grus japonensis]|uniref:Dynein axonemal heavy chain 11 n=1 Tax=Grus japonensis TaxID=30415 RepID=A0ABC9WI87_GRUJA
MLTDDAAIAARSNEGLPGDRMSTENATVLTNCVRWPLMIDPQQQGIKWIKNKYGADLKVIRLGQKGYIKIEDKESVVLGRIMKNGNRNFVKENRGSRYMEITRMDLAKSYEESSPAAPVVFILSPRADPLEDIETEYSSSSEESHPDFCVFIIAKPAPTPEERIIPQGILENSIKITSEPPTGMLDNLHAALYSFDEVPWEDLHYLFGEIMYGGHIIDAWDPRLCCVYLQEFIGLPVVKNVLDDILGMLAKEFNMAEIMRKTIAWSCYALVCLPECERMNLLLSEICRSQTTGRQSEGK